MGMGSDLAQESLSAHRAIPSISLGLGRGVVAHPLCLAKGSACGSGRAEFQWRLVFWSHMILANPFAS